MKMQPCRQLWRCHWLITNNSYRSLTNRLQNGCCLSVAQRVSRSQQTQTDPGGFTYSVTCFPCQGLRSIFAMLPSKSRTQVTFCRVWDCKRQTLTQTIHCFGSHRTPHLDHHSMKGYLHIKRLRSGSINPPNASSMAQGCDSLCLNILNAVPHLR